MKTRNDKIEEFTERIIELKKGDAFDEDDDEKDNSMDDLPF